MYHLLLSASGHKEVVYRQEKEVNLGESCFQWLHILCTVLKGTPRRIGIVSEQVEVYLFRKVRASYYDEAESLV